MRRFYLAFPIQDSLRPELTWTHYRKLIKVKDRSARAWYMREAADGQWSTRQLDRQISTLYYERLLASADQAPVKAEAEERLAEVTPERFIKDPYVLEFLDLKDYPALRETDLEQMDSYIRMFDEIQRHEDDNPTIGLILCSEKNEAIARYSALADGKQLFASKYVFQLPSAEQLEEQVESARREFEREFREGAGTLPMRSYKS